MPLAVVRLRCELSYVIWTKAPRLSVMRPPVKKLAVAKMPSLFFWKSALGSSLLEVFATLDRLAVTMADSGTVRSPIV